MTKSLDQTQLQFRNQWFKLVFFPLLKGYIDRAAIQSSYSDQELIDAAKTIYGVICEHKFVDIDKPLVILASCIYTNSPDGLTIADYLASFCQEKQIYWEDVRPTLYSLAEVKRFKESAFGKALSDFECFVSQDPKLNITQNQQQTVTQKASGTQQARTGTAVIDLNSISGLVSPNKVQLTGKVYWIAGKFADPNAKTKPRAHVKPVHASVPLTVFGNGSGQYTATDCLVFYKTAQEATDVLQQLTARKPAKVAFYEVKSYNAEPAGYYEVDTEFGHAFIRAKQLYEMLEAFDKEDEKLRLEALDKIKSIKQEDYKAFLEQACENFSKYIGD